MRHFSMMLLLLLGSLTVPTLLAVPAHATSYNFYTLDDGHQTDAYGIAKSGIAVVRNMAFCNQGLGLCYTEFVNGQQTASSDTPFMLQYAKDTACTVDGMSALCAGAYDVYASSNGTLYAGMAGNEVQLANSYSAGLAHAFLNARGDVLYSSGLTDESYEAITATPEPSTLLLLGSGLVGVAGSLRRRWL